MKNSNDFIDTIPLMITRACRLQGITQAELGRRIGYKPESMSRIATGRNLEGMPLGKLLLLLDLAECSFEWRRN